MALKLGFQGKLYYHATLITSSTVPSTWTLVDNAEDVTVSDAMREVDVETKLAAGVEEIEPSSLLAGLEFTMVYDPADTATAAMEVAYRARTAMAWGAFDATWASTVKGLIFNGKITKFERQQPVKGVQKVAITIKPCFASYARGHTIA